MPEEIVVNALSSGSLNISSPNVPTTPASPGNVGDIAWDTNFLYTCIAPNLWARTDHSIYWGEEV